MKLSLKRRLGPLSALLLATILLSACGSTISWKAMQGRHVDVVAEGDRQNYATMDPADLLTTCQSLVKIRAFDKFGRCYQALEVVSRKFGGRLKTHPYGLFSYEGQDTQNLPWSKFTMKLMLAKVAFELGDHEEAVKLSDDLVDLAQNSIFMSMRSQENLKGWRGSLGLVSASASLTPIIALDGYGVAALTYAVARKRIRAEKTIKILQGIETGTLFTRPSDSRRRTWIARALSAREDYEGALKVMKSSGKLSFGGAFYEVFLVASNLNPATYLFMPLISGMFSIGELRFVGEFEGRFMLHRAQLETGRLKKARAGYDEILADDRTKSFGGVYFLALYGRGRAAAAMGDEDIAITDFEQAIDVLETQRASITSEKGRIGFLGRKQNVYRDLVKILIKRGQAAKAFEYAERGKARALVDLLATRRKFPARTAKSAQLRGLVNSAAKEELQKVAAV